MTESEGLTSSAVNLSHWVVRSSSRLRRTRGKSMNTKVSTAKVPTAEGKFQPLQFLLDAASALGVQDLESAHDNVLGVSA